MIKKFRSFEQGLPIEDWQINRWIDESLDQVKNGATHWCTSSGDTSVAMFVWPSEIQVLVCTNQGRSTISFPLEGPFEYIPYERSVKDASLTAGAGWYPDSRKALRTRCRI